MHFFAHPVSMNNALLPAIGTVCGAAAAHDVSVVAMLSQQPIESGRAHQPLLHPGTATACSSSRHCIPHLLPCRLQRWVCSICHTHCTLLDSGVLTSCHKLSQRAGCSACFPASPASRLRQHQQALCFYMQAPALGLPRPLQPGLHPGRCARTLAAAAGRLQWLMVGCLPGHCRDHMHLLGCQLSNLVCI